jgi:hypothetical protein
MTLDAKIAEAIQTAVADVNQPEAIARQLTAWMEAIASGNEDPHDEAAAARRLEILYEETRTTESIEDTR